MTASIDENTQYIDPQSGELLVNGFVYIGENGLDAKLNSIIIYADRDLSIPILNPQRTGSDGRVVNKIWVPGQYSMKVENFENVQKLNDLSLGSDSITGNSILINVSGTNLLAAELESPASSLGNNQVYILTAADTNTDAMTLTIDLFPTYPIRKHFDSEMEEGDIEAGQTLAVIWNETDSIYELFTNSAVVPLDVLHTQTAVGVKTFTDGIVSDVTGDITGDLDGDLLSPTSITGIFKESKGSDVASAAELTLGTDGNSFDITGATDITSISTIGVGTHVTLQFDDVLTLTHHATDLILLRGKNIITAAGDVGVFYEYATGDWRCVSYTERLRTYTDGDYYGLSDTLLDIESVGPTWTTVGPTDSGATIIWTALDVITGTPDWIEIRIDNIVRYLTSAGSSFTYAANGDVSSPVKNNQSQISYNHVYNLANSGNHATSSPKIPINSSKVFKLYFDLSATITSNICQATLTGYGKN
jgi:hypothetical protein